MPTWKLLQVFQQSLIQSLGGDTEEAVKYADMVMTDNVLIMLIRWVQVWNLFKTLILGSPRVISQCWII